MSERIVGRVRVRALVKGESERETEAPDTERVIVRMSMRSTKKYYKYDNITSVFFFKIRC